ncbi:Glutathionyl-hydroquinone reductase YqjG [Ananas comosus]|uniref:Glutathionyl-hydroquinone reductase YqjG n=2 Tax=Ananas comosus TaxID=4615 RepID=A0A199V0I8_ANACO|nr:Glutathionyl-hydroquinone reductase YqjG [Ananas comosus]
MWTVASSLLSSLTPPSLLPSSSGAHRRRERRRPSPPLLLRRRRRSSSVTMATSSSADPLTALGRFLWGRSLPPQPLVSAVRSAWSATWLLMMRQLAPSDPSGSYSRPPGPFPSVPPSYLLPNPNPNPTPTLHLYVALPCPWAHRALLVRALRNLEPLLPVSVAAPGSDGSWGFRNRRDGGGGDETYGGDLVPGPDRANGRRTLREVYGMRRGGYDGRSTVPMLWDAEKKEVVCNESYAIIEFLNSVPAGSGPDLCPPELKGEIEKWNRVIYPSVNNGVYRCGFAQSQEAYDTAVNELFSTLDKLESHLSSSRYLCGETLTLADVCLFTTLIRFDLVYNVLFKCTKKKLCEYSNLHAYLRDIYQIPKVAETCNFEAIMDGYYQTLFPLNPSSIRPIIPSVCKHEFLSKPHNRETLSSSNKQLQLQVSLVYSASIPNI